MTYFVMALALVLGFTQCKKEQVNTPENETKTVNITLNVGGNGGGSRHKMAMSSMWVMAAPISAR